MTNEASSKVPKLLIHDFFFYPLPRLQKSSKEEPKFLLRNKAVEEVGG